MGQSVINYEIGNFVASSLFPHYVFIQNRIITIMDQQYLNPNIDLHIELTNQLYNVLRGDVVLPLYVASDGASYCRRIHDMMEGESLKVTSNTTKEIFDAFMEVKKALQIEDKVDLYIECNSEFNAFSVRSVDPDFPHIVRIQSALINLLTKEELKFVIGHELGHLVNKDSLINALYGYIYKRDDNDDEIPAYVKMRKDIFDQLSELAADRYGLIACGNLESCVSALYKISSGLNLHKLNVSIPCLMKENEEHLKLFMDDNGQMFGDHPALPLRVHALNVYANATSQDGLDEEMINIIHCFYKNTESEELFSMFVAAASLLVSNQDSNLSDAEQAHILMRIGDNNLFPMSILEEVKSTGKIQEVFDDCVAHLKDIPKMPARMMRYFVDVALADREFTKGEFDVVFEFGQQLGFADDEIADYITSVIKDTCFLKDI